MEKRSRRPLVLATLLFFAPLIGAFLLYYGGFWRPAASTHHGDLISPARPLPSIALSDPDGNLLPSDFVQHRWSLVYVGDGNCDMRCRAALADMRRARELLGRDSVRVQSVFLVNADCCDRVVLRVADASLLIARIDAARAAPLVALFPAYADLPVAAAGRIYVVDPLGNLMMSYAPDAPSTGMYDDLKKLLNLSHIG